MKITLLFTLLFTQMFISSCNKCSHCVVKDTKGSIVKDYQEKCGTNEDVANYEKSATEDAKKLEGELTCN